MSSVLVVEVKCGDEVTTRSFDSDFDRRVIIGRATECDLCVQDSGVSRKNTMLLATPAGWRVQDLGSTNGTLLNGKRVTEAAFGKGDVVRIGATEIRLVRAQVPQVQLAVDLELGKAVMGNEELPLSVAELIWFAYLAVSRTRGEGWVVAGVEGHAGLERFTAWVFRYPWARAVKSKPLLELARHREVDDEDLKNLRGKTAQKLRAFCTGPREWMAALVVPEVQGKNRQRIPSECLVKGAATLP